MLLDDIEIGYGSWNEQKSITAMGNRIEIQLCVDYLHITQDGIKVLGSPKLWLEILSGKYAFDVWDTGGVYKQQYVGCTARQAPVAKVNESVSLNFYCQDILDCDGKSVL